MLDETVLELCPRTVDLRLAAIKGHFRIVKMPNVLLCVLDHEKKKRFPKDRPHLEISLKSLYEVEVASKARKQEIGAGSRTTLPSVASLFETPFSV